MMGTVNFKGYMVESLEMWQFKARKKKIGNSWGVGGYT